MTGAGFLTLSGEPSETISIKSLGYDKDEAPRPVVEFEYPKFRD